MYTVRELEFMHLQDQFTGQIGVFGRYLIDRYGTEGEAVVREALRRFGRDRGLKRRAHHLSVGLKINMFNLFTYGSDLPNDPRFRRELIEINPQERISHTLICPMSDFWREMGCRDVGRIYCEEFHPACYSSYAYDKTRVNLARTLTQDGDSYCAFNVVLRPYTLTPEERKCCFAEFDPEYVMPDVSQIHEAPAKEGFRSLWLRIFFYMLECCLERFCTQGETIFRGAVELLVNFSCEELNKCAISLGEPVSLDLLERCLPCAAQTANDPMWHEYGRYNAQQLAQTCFCDPLLEKLGLCLG